MPDESWAWALVTVDEPLKDGAFHVLRDLAIKQQYAGRWYIKQIAVVSPMALFPPKNSFSVFVAVKAQDEATLDNEAFNTIIATMQQSGIDASVEGHLVGSLTYSSNFG